MQDRLSSGRNYKILTVLDEYNRQTLAVTVRARMGVEDVLEALYPLLLRQGTLEYIRSDNGPEFVAEAILGWLTKVGINPIRIYPGSPRENGYNERFNGSFVGRFPMLSGLRQLSRLRSLSINGSGSTITLANIRRSISGQQCQRL